MFPSSISDHGYEPYGSNYMRTLHALAPHPCRRGMIASRAVSLRWLARAALTEHRPQRRHSPGRSVKPSRASSPASCWCACRSKAMRDVNFPERGARLSGSRHRSIRCWPTPRSSGSPTSSMLYEDDALFPSPQHRRDAASRSHPTVVRVLRAGAGARDRPEAPGNYRRGLEPGVPGRPVRVSDRVRPIRVFDPSRLGALGSARGDGAAVPAARRRGSRVRIYRRSRAGSAGSALVSGRRRDSSNWDFSTSSTAPTICCSCSAW